MPDLDPSNPEPPSATPLQRLRARRYNERLKLTASALDRISTIVFGGAVLAPIFQHTEGRWIEFAFWSLIAIGLHVVGQAVLSFLREEP